jgi:tetratricopeptide (TPR) repeat protein
MAVGPAPALSAARWLLFAALAGCRTGPAPAPAAPAEPAEPAADETVQPWPAGQAELAAALAEIEAGELDAGLQALDALLAAAPDPAIALEARRWRGHVLKELGDPEAALREYRAALALDPHDPWLHYACGTAASEIGELEAACADFARAIELDPGHFKALQWLGEVHILLGDERAAVDDLVRAAAAIEAASDAALAYARTDRRSALLRTLALHVQALDALGEHEEAARVRERQAAVFAGN